MLLRLERLFEKGIISPTNCGGKGLLEGRPLKLPLFKQSLRPLDRSSIMRLSSPTRRLLQYLALVGVASLWLILLITGELGTDFYPLHFAARLTLAGDSPYGGEATARLVQSWAAPFA